MIQQALRALFVALLPFSLVTQAALPANRDTTFQTLLMDGLPKASVVLPDGKILVAGAFQNINGTARRAFARLNADGTLDASFNPPIAATSVFGNPTASAMVRQADGKIIVAGPVSFSASTATRTNILRFNADGSLDATLNANGYNHLTGLAVQPDGKIIFYGNVNAGVFKVIRLNADGSQDTSFNGPALTGAYGLQFTVQADGHILMLTGDNDPNRGGLSSLMWLKADGSQDTTYKSNLTLMDESRFALAPDGSVLVATTEGSSYGPIRRVATDGTVDASYSFVTQPNNQGLYPYPAAILPDGGSVLVRNPTAGDRRVSFFFVTQAGKLAGSRDLPNTAFISGLGVLPTAAFSMQPDGKLLFGQAFIDGSSIFYGLFRLGLQPAPNPPVITVQPTPTQTIGAGEALFMGVTATSESPMTYQWRHSSTNLTSQTNQALNLQYNSKERAGIFDVIVGNTFGYATSAVANITVRPPIALTFAVQPTNSTVKLSLAYSFNVQVTTDITIGYQWYKNSQPIMTAAGQSSYVPSLNLPANDAARTGDYFVVVTNDFGGSITSQVAHLEVILPGAPVITTQPQDLALFSTQPVQLSVAATSDSQLVYQWQHAGTNLKASATIPNVTGPSLYVFATDTNRFGTYDVIVTGIPGGSVTSRVATVTSLPNGLPVILSQPSSLLNLPFGQATNLTAAFNGVAPLSVYLQHAGTNVPLVAGIPYRATYGLLDGPATNSYLFNALPETAGSYQFVISNSFGAVASQIATVSHIPAVGATIVNNMTNTVVGIGEFNFAPLTSGLVVTNGGNQETTHILSFSVQSALGPFRGLGNWQLALGVSNKFYVGENTGAAKAIGTWGYAPGAAGYMALSLTNFPRANDLSRLEAFDDGRYALIMSNNTALVQNGTYRVLGATRPATNVFTFDLRSTNSVSVTVLKDGSPVNLGNRGITVAGPPSGPDRHYVLTMPNVGAADLGMYSLSIDTLTTIQGVLGNPITVVSSTITSAPVSLTFRGYAETNAPGVVAAFELGSATALDEPTAAQGLSDGSILLGVKSTTFGSGSGSGGANVLTSLSADGKTNWQYGYVRTIRSVLPDGAGGAFVGGHDGDQGNFFLQRIHPAIQIAGGRTNYTATNLWFTQVESTSTNFTSSDANASSYGAEVVGMLPATNGVYVAGRFRGKTRFGTTNVAFISTLYYPLGGTTITNAYDATFNQYDRSWDVYVAKYDFAGKLLWVKGYGGTNSETLTSFTTDAAGNLYLAGSFKGGAKFGALSIESTKRIDSGSVTNYATDGFIAKLGGDGTPVWVKNFGDQNTGVLAETQIPSAVSDAAGNVYFLAARDQSFALLQPGIAVGSRYLARLGTTGDLQWAQTIECAGNAKLALDADGNAILADAPGNPTASLPMILGAAKLDRRLASGTFLAKFAPSGTLLWHRMLDEKLAFADDPRTANMRLTTFAPNGELLIIGSFSGGNSSSSTRNAGQRFDGFELFTTNNATVNPTDVFIARLAANYDPSAPLLAMVTPLSITGLLQDSLTLEGRASGVPSPSYQWLLNGQPIAGATNRALTFGSLQRTNRGNYSLVASNAVGVTTSPAIALTPQLRTNMTGWTLATSSPNYLGEPVKIGADDAGNSYMAFTATGNGGAVELRKYDRNGNATWSFNSPAVLGAGYVLNAFSPLVTPAGEIFISGRLIIVSSSRTENNFVARLNPADGSILWLKNLGNVGPGQFDPAAIREMDLNAPGKIRVLLSDKTVRTFAFDGTESPKVTLSFLPAVLNQAYGRYALDANGGVYFYANRFEALNLGGTNFTALSNAGMQSYVLARYDAGGTFLWSRAFPGPGGLALTPVLNVDAQGNLLIAGELSFSSGQTIQVGTNLLSGYGYLAKVTPVGEVAWAKAWWLHFEDAALRADGSIFIDGWFRYELLNNNFVTNGVHFGTNIVRGSSLTSHDFFVAKVDANGNEQFIRQTGSPDFSTEDNARPYSIAVDSRGVVTTAGYTRAAQTGAGLDFGDLRYEWPNLLPYGHNGNPSKCYFIARLEVDASPAPPSAPQLAFTLPAPGATTIKLSWPDGFQLQRFVPGTPGVWETLAVPSPYDASVSQFKQAFFRVIKAP